MSRLEIGRRYLATLTFFLVTKNMVFLFEPHVVQIIAAYFKMRGEMAGIRIFAVFV